LCGLAVDTGFDSNGFRVDLKNAYLAGRDIHGIIVELLRAGHVVLRLDSPEPITDRPFRETNAMTCFSTEFLRHWRADFGDAPPQLRGEYADDDHVGRPNWLEMTCFGKFLDWDTGQIVDSARIARAGARPSFPDWPANQAHAQHGRAVSNFAALLPAPQSDLAQQALKDPYIFDFLTLTEPFHEGELETQLVRDVEKFLLELGGRLKLCEPRRPVPA